MYRTQDVPIFSPFIHLVALIFATVIHVFFIQDWLHPGWCVVLQKEPRSRRVLDNNDEQIMGILGDLSGLQLPVDMNATDFRTNLMNVGETVPATEMARLNALVRGDAMEDGQHARAHGQRTLGRGRGRRGT